MRVVSGRRLGASMLLVVALWWLLSGTAFAHAVLLEADPADGARLDDAPAEVRLRFNEPVDQAEVRVFDAAAQRVDRAPVGTGAEVGVALPADLPSGGYVTTYRVVSQDGHPISGVLRFTVGDGAPVADDVVAAVTTGDSDLPRRLLRGLTYVTALLAAGAALAGPALATTPAAKDRLARLVDPTAALTVGLTVLVVPVQAAAQAGGALLGPGVLGRWQAVLASTTGQVALVRAVAFAALAWATTRLGPRGLAASGALAVATFALDGHQRTAGWQLAAIDVVHVVVAAAWFGGLVLLALLLRDHPDEPLLAARWVARFSTLALVGVGLAGVSGAAMAVRLVGGADGLATTYGRLLIAKVLLVAAVVAIAAVNRFWLVPTITSVLRAPSVAADPQPDPEPGPVPDPEPGATATARQRLGTTLRAEVGVLVGVLLLTGVLATEPPGALTDARGFVQTTLPVGDDLELDVVVEPAQVGVNTLHAYLLTPDGRPATADDLRFELTYRPADIGPIVLDPPAIEPGHWLAATDALTFAGPWELRIVLGLDRFTELVLETTLEITP